MNIHKRRYIENLSANMRSAGQDNWLQYDMLDLCEMAGLYDDWLNTSNRLEEEKLTLKAASILGVEIRHCK